MDSFPGSGRRPGSGPMDFEIVPEGFQSWSGRRPGSGPLDQGRPKTILGQY